MLSFKNFSMKKKLGTLFLGVFIVLTLFLSGFYFFSQKTLNSFLEKEMRNILFFYEKNINISTKMIEEQLKRNLAILNSMIIAEGGISESNDEIQIEAINQETKEKKNITVKKYFAGTIPIHNNFEIVDKIKMMTGNVATIFQRIDGGYLRISTNVMTKDNNRAVGTYIPDSSPVAKAISEGKTFIGKAKVVDKWYLTAYEPFKINNEIKGMTFVGIEENSVISIIENDIKSISIGNGDSPALLHADTGEWLIHKTMQGKNEKDSKEWVATIIKNKEKDGIIDFVENNKNMRVYYKYIPVFKWIMVFPVQPEGIIGEISKILEIVGIAFIIFILFLWIVVFTVISKFFIRPLIEMIPYFEKGASGDLREKIAVLTKDEIGFIRTSFNNFMESVALAVKGIMNSANQVLQSSEEVASGNTSLSSSTQEMASSLEETAASVEEITSSIKETSDMTIFASKDIKDASDKAEKSSEMLLKMENAMIMLKDSGSKIAEIVDVVNEIAFQTNLLALNAAVEAARAGEMGKGFAVVASEVRSLASRSADAATQIKQIIASNELNIQNASKLSIETSEKIKEVLSSISKTAKIMSDIEQRAKEQSSGILQINDAVTQMDEVTQRNAALVEELASSSEDLSRVAKNLFAEISKFNV